MPQVRLLLTRWQIDLDTIELSNLNRQFLFHKKHINQSKAIVARDTASAFNPDVRIVAHHANIKSHQFDAAYYASFDVVLSALDNLDTRRWVNRMCVMARVPLIESGTAGFLGQVQPIRPSYTECYDCTEHPTPTTFPVCTIRSTPSTPVHCIVWAKNWLLPQLFGELDNSDEQEFSEAAKRGEDAEELQRLRQEAQQMLTYREQLYASLSAPGVVCERIFDKLYSVDIQRLLSMEDMWEHRTRPEPLTFASACSDTSLPIKPDAPTLRDRRQLTLAENAALFVETTAALAKRAASGTPVAFDKDDDETLGFVTAAANLRARVYHIPEQTRFDTKQIAGNIIPAIATTNAIVAGLVVVEALHMLASRWSELRVVSLARRSTRLFTTFPCSLPNPKCGVCQDTYVRVCIDPENVTLQHVLDAAHSYLGYADDADLSISAGARILYDADLDDNLPKLLRDLHVHAGDTLSIVDENGVMSTAQFVLERRSDTMTSPLYIEKAVQLGKRSSAEKEESDDEDGGVQVLETAPTKRARDADHGESKTKRIRAQNDTDNVIVLD